MIDFDNQTELEIDISLSQKIASSLTKKDIELILMKSSDVREINKIHRCIDKDTDVLSFPYEDVFMAPLGSIVISSAFVEEKSKELGHSQNDEFTLLFIHGLLHLLGYDHEVDNGEMREMETKLIEKFNLPKSLIVRTTDLFDL